ncbi:bifunctional tRNA (5-methylaminomethyl-2-thiouridine)(34)-methyltransferase MnmD/FAD-dependent 5-carboxymethylaminomethyl-2-thiouridine(34) oxidoreductase MnmC [Alteromonadaceae bacterium BrNp21-10]|nr:bifunctional tRNA (5-methylaminomethyl-2-thiouridine)(34)-methyltransferase MnmD/FAD-dependent 5-carboxymethylaminomethyl-2-thiouridine(34) oxidoreductase MnmC [Alteromonadaceae bacterium BrNp21-10]
MNIKPANIEFNQHQAPIARDFADIYYSNDSGLAESQFVFIQNNHLETRWQQWQQTEFVVAESGFGTGLNFLALWQQFRQFKLQFPNTTLRTLRFISVEKYPLTQQDFARAAQQWPELNELAKLIVQQYPFLHQGCHRLQFDDNSVQLDLWFGDIKDVLDSLYSPTAGIVDAWFLDGFAPSKNPEMWNDSLFNNMVKLGKQDSTFATFTAAGFVRRGLQQAGYEVNKVKGHGKKREMLTGTLNHKPRVSLGAPYFSRETVPNIEQCTNKNVTIIGAGLAGANLAYSLSRYGYAVQLFCKDKGIAQGASGNPLGGFYPQLHTEANISSLLQAQCFGFALRRYQQLLRDGGEFQHDFCGVLQLAFTDAIEQRYEKFVEGQAWPTSLARLINHTEVKAQSGLELPYKALSIEQGGWINPPQLVKALLQSANSEIHCDHQLIGLQPIDNQWQLHWQHSNGQKTSTLSDIVVFASGSDSVDIPLLNDLPYRLVRGQVESVPSQPTLAKLKTVLCHKGYLTPAVNGQHALGSTYIKNDRQCDYRESEEHTNIAILKKALKNYDWQKLYSHQQGRAAIRCSSADHIPLVGALADIPQQQQQYQDLYKALPLHCYPPAINHPNLYTLTGLGSRGLCTAPLLAEILACQISGAPLPLNQSLLDALNPNRFLVRALQRRQDYGD